MNEAASTCEFAHAVSSSMEKGKQDLLSKHVHFIDVKYVDPKNKKRKKTRFYENNKIRKKT